MNRPVITYKKWWHRFLPYYRRNIKALDALFKYEWEKGDLQKEIDGRILKTYLYGE